MLYPSFKFERLYWKKGLKKVCGLDEVGRGCFAGPVVVGAVVFHPDVVLPLGINDSKLLSAKKRERFTVLIKEKALYWAVAEVGVTKINQLGIGKATQMAFRKAIKNLKVKVDFILIDAFYIKHCNRKKQQAIIKGDQLSLSISAASIIAKVHRDKLMDKLHQKFPYFGWNKNKGYGTLAHRQAIKKYGLSPLHRKSFNLSKFLQ